MQFSTLSAHAKRVESENLDCFAATCLFKSLMTDLKSAAGNQPLSQLPFDEEQTGKLLSNLVFIMNIGKDIYNAKKGQLSNVTNSMNKMISDALASLDEIEALSKEVDKKLEELDDACKKLDEAKKEYDEKQKQFEEAQAAQEECDKLTEEIEKIEREIENYKDADPEALRKKLVELGGEYERLEGEIGGLSRQCEDAQNKLDDARNEKQRLSDEYDETIRSISGLEREIDRLNNDIADNQSGIETLTEEKDKLTKENSKVEENLNKLKNEVNELKGKVKQAESELSELTGEQDSLRQKETNLLDDTAKVRKEIERLNGSIPVMQSKLDEKEEDKTALDNRYTELIGQINKLEDRNNKFETDVIQKLESSLEKESGRRDRLGSDLIRLLADCGIKMENDTDELDRKILTEAGKYTDLNAKLETKQKEYDECTQKNKTINSRIAELTKRIEELKNTASEERNAVYETQLQQEIDRLEGLLKREKELETTIENKKKNIDEINSLIQKAEDEKEKLSEQLNELSAISAEDLRNRIKVCSGRLELLKTSRSNISDTLAALKELLLPEEAKKHEAVVESLKNVINSLSEKIAELRIQLDDAAGRCQNVINDIKGE